MHNTQVFAYEEKKDNLFEFNDGSLSEKKEEMESSNFNSNADQREAKSEKTETDNKTETSKKYDEMTDE